MNRIILIGNGFDLAHNIETSYTQFLNSYWSNTIENIFKSNGDLYFDNEQLRIDNCPRGVGLDFDYHKLKKHVHQYTGSMIFKNTFLEHISEKQNLKTWVDIEEEYYKLLKDTIQEVQRGELSSLIKLNENFKEIQLLLEEYLNDQVKKKKLDNNHRHCLGDRIYSLIEYDDLSEIGKTEYVKRKKGKYLSEISKNKTINSDDKDKLNRLDRNLGQINEKDFLREDRLIKHLDFSPENVLFLNFNYTSTCRLYSENFISHNLSEKFIGSKVINIHGSINSEANPIIFGYGDELDDDYKIIEKINENKLLDNIKSIKYLETANYKSLLQFIESDIYQVFVMGHSCGTSDRTLLNSLFEHDNCQSIKFFYHKKENGDDNYSDVIRNISRNFNNKVVMRDKVVNKKYCKSLID